MTVSALALALCALSAHGSSQRPGPAADVHEPLPVWTPIVPPPVATPSGWFKVCKAVRKCPGQSPCEPVDGALPAFCDRCSYQHLDEFACRFSLNPLDCCVDTTGAVPTCGPYWLGDCYPWHHNGQFMGYYCDYPCCPNAECKRAMCVST